MAHVYLAKSVVPIAEELADLEGRRSSPPNGGRGSTPFSGSSECEDDRLEGAGKAVF